MYGAVRHHKQTAEEGSNEHSKLAISQFLTQKLEGE